MILKFVLYRLNKMTTKSILNLRLQSEKLPTVKYVTKCIDNTLAHAPVFECTVEFFSKTFSAKGANKISTEIAVAEQILKFLDASSGGITISKLENSTVSSGGVAYAISPKQFSNAMKKVAENSGIKPDNAYWQDMYDNAKPNDTLLSPTDLLCQPPSLREVPKIIFVDLENVPQIKNCKEIIENNRVIGFTSKFSSIYTQLDKYKGIEIHTTSSAVKNAADVLMIYHITSMIFNNELRDKNVYILSRDMFSPALKDILKEKSGIKIKHVTTVGDVV
jgi:hypothetical protein